ncbi:hypothetical protein NDU88_011348 [Pleurodeles waltl]|uniref:Uncharacterized protein n=1 Tax=Pleurodeles waltl TaxID=8319 RepID=A0AAV7Q4G5_PLEWA|nr:hypothetical protein NDU88_011348 [Pleurodeles waltl]
MEQTGQEPVGILQPGRVRTGPDLRNGTGWTGTGWDYLQPGRVRTGPDLRAGTGWTGTGWDYLQPGRTQELLLILTEYIFSFSYYLVFSDGVAGPQQDIRKRRSPLAQFHPFSHPTSPQQHKPKSPKQQSFVHQLVRTESQHRH